MNNLNFIPLILVVANVLFSYRGFNNHAFLEGYQFEIDKILVGKDYKRMLTSGFLHVSWMHLIFNMIALYAFSTNLVLTLGAGGYLLVYFASLTGGNLLALFIHRNHGDYTAVGASGAISGLVFATIAIDPTGGVGLILLPVYIPGWLFGIIYVAVSIYGIRSKRDNIGHEAHLGGALAGMLLVIVMVPGVLAANFLVILLLLVPTVVFIFLIARKPEALLIDNLFYKEHEGKLTIDEKYNFEQHNKQQQVDRILDKISRRGVGSLSAKEKDFLERNS